MEGRPKNFWDIVNMPDDAYLYFPSGILSIFQNKQKS
jgi:hypothetical protein